MKLTINHIRLSFQKKIGAVFVLVTAILATIFFAFNKNNTRTIESGRWVNHTNEVILKSLDVAARAQDIVSSVRGFVITGDENYLAPFYAALPGINNTILQLKSLTRDNARQQVRVDSLQKLIDENTNIRTLTINTRKEKGREAATAIIEAGNGKTLSDKISLLLDSIKAEETQLLVKRKTESDQNIYNGLIVVKLLEAVAFILLLAAFKFIYDNTRLRNTAEEKIKLLNLTLEKRVEEKTSQVIEKEQQYRFLLENMREGIQVIGFDYRYKYINNAVVAQSRHSRDELVGYTMTEKYPGIEKTEMFKVLQRCMEERRPQLFENDFAYPDGSAGAFELSFQPVPEGLLILSVDTSERKKAAEEIARINTVLEKRAAELEVSNAELERFAYIASHDLQEPLRMISSFLKLLEKRINGQLDQTSRQYINFATDGALRMKALIEDLLLYAKVDNKKDILDITDMNDIAKHALQLFEKEAEKIQAKITIGQLPVIKVNKILISQLLVNLLSNAFKYHSQEPTIEVGCLNEEKAYLFYVKDNGIGIDPKFFDRIFVIFQRLHNKQAYTGTGIGLAICKKIVEIHAGKIWVESAPGAGSKFYFSIPK